MRDKEQQLVLPFTFPSLNEYIKALKKHRLSGQAMKTDYTDQVTWECKKQKIKPYENPVAISFIYFEKSKKRDPDNIVFAKKFILDGLVNAGVIPNDTQKFVMKFTDKWFVSRNHPGVYVIIREWENDEHNILDA